MVEDIELADAVAVLRDELLAAAAQASAGGSSGVEFVVGPIELEFAVELRRDASVKAGFKAWVLSGEAAAGVAQSRAHRVAVTLTPRRPGGGDLLVSARADEATPLPGAAGADLH